MNLVMTRWTELEPMRKLVIVLGAFAMLISLAVLTRMATQPSMSLLYSGLEASQAGEVVRALEQRGETYEIKGGTIHVPHSRRDELRMILASEGLPANSTMGYEILDGLSGFGTTSQMFDAAYLRAKEGELARTIVSSPQIAMARVHIAQTRQSAFDRTKRGSASVFVTPSGAGLDASQAKALRFLVASAVAGVAPENVSIVDEKGGLIGSDDPNAARPASDALSAALKSKVERLLEARVGSGNAIVEVTVETETQSEQITERIFDPNGRVVISTDNEERTDTAEGTGSAGVTVASNLPDGEAGGAENSKSNASETRERINYEVSETQREIIKSPGAIKRQSIAVLVNGVEDANAPGTILPRSEDELAQLTALVRSAVGFVEERGDAITVQSMVFTPDAPQGTGPVQPPLLNMTLDAMTLLQMGILALVTIVIALFVVRPVLRAPQADSLPALAPPPSGAENDPIIDSDFDIATPDGGAITIMGPEDAMSVSDALDDSQNTHDNPIQRLREMIETRQEETVDILRHWLEQKEQQSS